MPLETETSEILIDVRRMLQHATLLARSHWVGCHYLLQDYALQLNVCNVPESPSQAWKAGSDQVVPWLLATCILAL